MIEKLKIIFSNSQMRSLIYLVFGIISIIILILIYNPTLEYRSFNPIIDEEDVKVPYDKYKEILENYSNLETYFYRISYNNEVIKGYSIAGIFNDNYDLGEIENIIKPNNIYNIIKDKEYTKSDKEYIYDLDKKIVIVVNDEEVIKVIYDDIIIEYGG